MFRAFLQFISEHEPRKGTETREFFFELLLVSQISEHEPRKGTETGVAGRESVRLHDHFRTRTPKGDGNFFGGCANSLFRVFISERESRKRMEQAMISY